MNYQINDILYTKDGRKCGNLIIVDIVQTQVTKDTYLPIYTCMSDYGNMIKTWLNEKSTKKQFYTTPGKATESHKYYNYKETHPEMFI